MKVEQLLGKSEALIYWLDERINGVTFKAEVRSQLAVSCLDGALEHQKAIVLLISQSLHGIAFALVRLIFEAYVRGKWLHRCASDTDLELFQTDAFDTKKRINTLIQDLEKLNSSDRHVLSTVKTQWWSAMCSYTHSGYFAARRRLTEEAISPNYTEDQIIEVLTWANALGIMAAIEIAQIANNYALAQTFLEKFSGCEDI